MERENRLLMLFITIIVIALLGALYFVHKKMGRVESPAAETDAQSKVAANLVEVPMLSDTKEQSSEPQKHMTYEVHFPVVALAERPELAKDANAVITAFTHDSIDAFKKDVDDMLTPDMPIDSSSDFSMRWSALLLSPTIISLRFDFSEYIAGAAHPNSGTRILNYDLEKHLLIQTPDLFASSSQAFGYLSDYSRTSLQTMFADQPKDFFDSQVKPGTEPTAENFEQVGITKTGLLVIFSPYQVAPYARGTIQISLPLEEIRDVISSRVSQAIEMASTNIIEATPEENGSSTQKMEL